MARRTSLDWFTQRLYHNTDRMLARTSFPSTPMRVMDHVEIDHGNGLLDRIARLQVDVALSLEDTYAAMRTAIWSTLRGDNAPVSTTYLDHEMVESIDVNMYYQRMRTPTNNCQYNVGREFKSHDRIVFLVGNVRPAADPNATHVGWRSRLAWYILERLGPLTTRVRVLLYNAPCINANGEYMTWHEEHCKIDCSFCHVPEADRWTTHQRFMDDYAAMYLTEQWHELGLHLLPTVPS
ncbi:hypothetical protein SPRG_17157 [Saprolegnia parasitica CBS 223.65]|uniref:Uncharacterized protein n=1 Tax=Saprolegnia parasitica (strain CBS 223.65) TaxID=695850 RepID=A0A067BGW6_SAPPC|nr:hypothetical protein SPRG_17157 [Saprolegnia parasitica CBS 223.65]KDO17408.1 hypothetical protein SPRG_17157 [Saprolegnia parasitica CBS 223.65]|eukprot:XP_012211885.1 hypothetical protein SPRG_17157 [Saprolegnia parasitica CBS 223.65]